LSLGLTMVPEQQLPPTSGQRDQLRQAVVELVKERGKEQFQEADLARFETDNGYVERFWIHGFFIPGPDRVRNTAVLAVEALRWRSEFGVAAITEESLDRGLLEGGSLYSRGRDTNGGRLLVLSVKRYIKDPKMTPKRMQLFVYMLERIDRETKGDKITIIFDCQSAGLKNFELEAVQFIIKVLIHYYPNLVRRIIVLEMHWTMDYVWKLVKSLLPGPAQEMVKFCIKANITEYVDVEGLPKELGGSDDWQYCWEPEEQVEQATEEVAEVGSGQGWRLTPPEKIVFRVKSETSSDLEASITVSNRCPAAMAYKVRSTRPALFLVTPHSGLLQPGQQAEVRLRALVQGQPRLERERFQVAAVMDVRDGEDVRAVFEDRSRPAEVWVLGCEVERSRRVSLDTPATVEQANKQARVLALRLGEVEERMGQLRAVVVVQCCLLLLGLAYFFLRPGHQTEL